MERELAELFPKQSDLRLQAVRLLMYLEESGPKKQAELAEESGLEEYAMSRLLARLELHRYITRRRDGTDKVSLSTESLAVNPRKGHGGGRVQLWLFGLVSRSEEFYGISFRFQFCVLSFLVGCYAFGLLQDC